MLLQFTRLSNLPYQLKKAAVKVERMKSRGYINCLNNFKYLSVKQKSKRISLTVDAECDYKHS